MPLFNVRIVKETVAVVVAENPDDAVTVGKYYANEAFADDCACEPEITIIGEVTQLDDLESSWDAGCHPYGDTQCTIKDYLA